ncbi:ComEC/Rec2 family competence protein [Streptomyces sp. BPTC-684]|uniref:ComEC/Rec2 family competence protein n=1 Tax=Streptomyces sp. BPTC-684 TaxID=3043734 RepID=UPI0024B22A23|nr:ComEC/Rec2 family competence protein [Streptomyces sp. BPTC-684]WHM38788.1 ComEC/Rec2 family competence protein [Streptomyces sp. BPTC-684]
MNRPGVHVESGNPLGAANPHQEGPPDLRLVPPAIGAWAAAAVALNAPAGWVIWGIVAFLVVAGVLLGPTIRRWGSGVGGRAGPRGGGGPAPPAAAAHWAGPAPTVAAEQRAGPAPPLSAAHRAAGSWWANRVAVAAVLLCAAAGATASMLHVAEGQRGPVPGLARQYAHATVDLTLTSDPRPVRARAAWGGRSVVIQAVVTRVVGPDGGASRVRTPVLVTAPESWQGLLPSTRVRVSTRLAPPRPDDKWAAAVVRVPGRVAPQVVGEPTALQRTAGGLRAGLREAADGLSPDARALLPGLVVGDTSRVTPELRDAFEETDLTHLMAVSGSNLVIVLVLLIGPPGRASLAERGGLAPRLGISLRATALLGGMITVAFVVVCRPEPSVLRAAACGLVTLLAIATGRRRSLIPALAAAVLVLVLYAPELAGSYGFLLSVLATGALLTIAPGWSEALRRRGVPGGLAEVLAAAGAAQAVCAPVVAVFAARVSLVAVPCNLLAELAVAPATVLGFAALAVAPVAMPVAELLAWCAGRPTGWIADIARTGAALPGAQTGWPGGWGGGALLAGVTVGAVFLARRLPRHPWVAAGCAVLLLLVVVRPAPLTRVVTGWPPPGWAFAMCDVGQGDATVLAAGEGTAVVVDAGPDPVPADRCLRALGVTRIPLLLLTHFHADHVAGLAGVLRGRAVGVIETATFEEPPEQARFVRRTAAEAGVPVVPVEPGERRAVGGLTWQALWPLPPPTVTPDGPNDASVTLLVRAGGLTLLLPGDLEPPAQQALLRARPELPPVDVLKVAHHGSAHQDPALLRAIRPRLALISAGRGNPYGHPAPATVSLLAASGARVLRTDTDGAIAVTGRGSGAGSGLMAVPLGRGP